MRSLRSRSSRISTNPASEALDTGCRRTGWAMRSVCSVAAANPQPIAARATATGKATARRRVRHAKAIAAPASAREPTRRARDRRRSNRRSRTRTRQAARAAVGRARLPPPPMPISSLAASRSRRQRRSVQATRRGVAAPRYPAPRPWRGRALSRYGNSAGPRRGGASPTQPVTTGAIVTHPQVVAIACA